MHFTREPIIETIITPKDGHKLVLRSPKGGGEEFFVDMVEVITFGHTTFYRSFEKPKPFVVPTADYDVIEVREARMALKSTVVEKVKIAGGKKEDEEKKGRSKRTRKKKEIKAKEEVKEESVSAAEEPEPLKDEEAPKKLAKPTLIPPPPTLISESLARYKEGEESASVDEDVT